MKLPNDQIIHYESKDGISIDITRTELVRCEDCKYSIEVKESDSIICRHPSQHSTYERTGDDYCSYGERRE